MTNVFTITFVLAFFLSQMTGVPGCGPSFSSYSSFTEPSVPVNVAAAKQKAKMDRIFPKPWSGFDVPAAVKKKWNDWLAYYKKQRALETAKIGSKDKKDRGPGSHWPQDWQGLGKGFDGAPPPPWAYEPVNHGLPSYCYLPLQKGNCSRSITRYAYNSYLEECVSFQYTGCGENKNNFVRKLKCEQSCMKLPMAGCDPETKQRFDD